MFLHMRQRSWRAVYPRTVRTDERGRALSGLPGAELVEAGIADLERGVDSVEALLVSIGAPRLERLGFDVPVPIPSPEHRLVRTTLRGRGGLGALALQRARATPRELRARCGVRGLADSNRIGRFMRALGHSADSDGACYFTGGATAVLYGWRESTIDVDIRLAPETEPLLRAIQNLKNDLAINVELASPADFIPVPPGWEDRSVVIGREGRLTYYHFDLLAQALAKLERAHSQDLGDVAAMIARELIAPVAVLAYFERLEPELFRFPAIDPRAFRRRVEEILG